MHVAPIKTTVVAASAALVLMAGALGGCSSHSDDASAAARGRPSPASTDQADSAVDSLLAAGQQQLDDGQVDAAASTFDSVLDLDVDNSYALYNLGLIAQRNSDEPGAIERYTDVLAEDPDFSPALYNLAILTEKTDLPGAVALYRREIFIKPDDAAAYMRLGFALQHLGEQAEAERMLAAGVELDPSMAGIASPSYG